MRGGIGASMESAEQWYDENTFNPKKNICLVKHGAKTFYYKTCHHHVLND